MKAITSLVEVVKKPLALVSIAVLLVVILVWFFVLFMPQSHKLSTLESQRTALQQNVLQDQIRLQTLRKESHHVGQIQAIDAKLKGYVPTTEGLYTYIQTISLAGNKAGITITSLQPGALVPASGTAYSAIPIAAQVKGTYDDLVEFLNDIYNLPRLTDINSISITGGGPGTDRSTQLNVNLNLVIFTSEKAST